MDIVFLFMSQSSASPGSTPDDWCATESCDPYYNEHFKGEGYFKQLGYLKEKGIINNLSIFYESNKGSGKANWLKDVDCQVIPEIRFVDKYIKKDTIIFVRGGFRHWHDWLLKYKGKNWIMLYAANTGRQRWAFWDIVLNDLNVCNHIDSEERYWHHFIKPIDQDTFYPKDLKPQYDLCIGSSHIHDKKGQWRCIQMLKEYEEMFGTKLKCIMPGSFRRSTKTLQMIPKIPQFNIEMCGMLKRNELNNVFNKSKYFIHLGTHGQNDRGPLEALACGTPVILGSPAYHAELMYKNNSITFVPNDINDFKGLAKYINILLTKWEVNFRKEVYKKYLNRLSFEKSCDRMQSLLLMMNILGEPTLQAKQRIKSSFDIINTNSNWELLL